MSSVRVEWMGDAFLARVAAAAEVGLDTAASALQGEIVRTLSKTTGQVTGKNATGRNLYKASLPGTPPGARSGSLRRSIAWNRAGTLRRRVGTNLKYARIHELGGTINHPGGTAYTFGPNGAVFLSNAKAEQVAQRGGFVGRTRPHPINMPRRPYLVPTLAAMAASGKLNRTFNAAFKRQMRQA